MNTTKSWTLKSEQQQSLMHSFISTVKQTELTQKNHLCESLSEMDKMLSRVYARHHYDPMMVTKQSTLKNSNTKLQLPCSNTLTDALIRNTLGCDQKYAKQYMQLIGQTTSENQKQRKILEIKKKFSDSNSYVDTMANAKPFVPMKSWQTQRPVVDNEHESYLKTQLIFLQKPNNQKISEKQYYQKYYDTITKKIQQLGGMEDTLCRMEHTLKQNQMSNVKDRQILKQPQNQPKDNLMSSKSQFRNVSQIIDKESNSWKVKSRQMREKYRQSINKNT